MISRRRGRTGQPSLPSPKVGARQLFAEATAGILQRPGRSVLTMVGTVLGIGAFVAILGITSTANSQITKRFSALAATAVTVEQAVTTDAAPQTEPLFFPDDTEHRLSLLNGVKASGIYWDAGSNRRVSTQPPGRGLRATSGVVTVMAASPEFWTAAHPVVQGRVFDSFLADQQVAVVGRSIARQLGLTNLAARPAVFIDDVPFTIVGILDDTKRVPDTLLSVTIPMEVSRRYWGVPEATPRILIETELGAADLIARQAPVALRPDHPELLTALTPPTPTQLKDRVSADLSALFLALAGICLLIGAVGIANTTLVAVMERVPEIGLRRSLGALPRHIASQFLAESVLLGGLGGILGTSLGSISILVVAIGREWTATVPTWALAVGPALGAFAGLLAGVYPSIRAARIEPVEAFRR